MICWPLVTLWASFCFWPARTRAWNTPFMAIHTTKASEIHVWLNSKTSSLVTMHRMPNSPARISAGA